MAAERELVTAEELLRLPDDGQRRELIDGELRCMAPAGGPHGQEGGRLFVRLGHYVDANGLGEVFLAETGFLLGRDEAKSSGA